MARKVIELYDGKLQQTPTEVIEASEASIIPTANGILRADLNGEIAAGWIPDSVRTVNIEEADGVPALTNILTLVVGANLTLTNLGAGSAQIDADEQGGSGVSLTVEEADGSPSVANVSKIIVGNGDLIDNGSGVVRVKTAADASGGSGGGDGTGGLLYLYHNTI
ncbi:MAG: hypothetical protein HC910_21885 [Spirulinaceae cyanobacterium SM2_1_0]|nr:hypothetical protein [Spirulinaceae cyanobacterium SM2_1_0]